MIKVYFLFGVAGGTESRLAATAIPCASSIDPATGNRDNILPFLSIIYIRVYQRLRSDFGRGVTCLPATTCAIAERLWSAYLLLGKQHFKSIYK